jgi:hypothetical protein
MESTGTSSWPETISPVILRAPEIGSNAPYEVYDGMHRLVAWTLLQIWKRINSRTETDVHENLTKVPAILLKPSTTPAVAASLAMGEFFFKKKVEIALFSR